jgi:hypothetical protein
MNIYKGFRIGEIVTVKKTIEHQYYNYPKGYNLKTLKVGEKAIINSIMPKVRVTESGTGEYFFNLVRHNSKDVTIYPVFDYHNLVKIES